MQKLLQSAQRFKTTFISKNFWLFCFMAPWHSGILANLFIFPHFFISLEVSWHSLMHFLKVPLQECVQAEDWAWSELPLLWISCCVWDHCSVAFWPSLVQASADGQMVSRLALESFGLQKSSWLTWWLQGAQILWLQNKLKLAQGDCLFFTLR